MRAWAWRLALGVVVAGAAQFAQGPAGAETSSWQQRIAPAKPVKPKRPGTAGVKSHVVEPSRMPKEALQGGSGATPAASKASLGPTTTNIKDDDEAAKPGSDAAYEAFDQGKYLTALAIAARQAKQGDAIAHTLVARIHAEGLGVPQNTKLAAQWYARGAELGDPESALGLGTLYARGDGVPQDYTKAAELFEKAASKGHPEAAYNLALLFLAGKGKPELPRRGFMLMQYAAEKGVVAAMYDLGTLYATGTGIDPNAFQAAHWIGKAANAGYPEAEVEYAIILMKDHNLPAEQLDNMRRRAVELLRAASRKGLVVAQNRLAHCYADGLGTKKNPVEALKWHLIAQAGGHDDAGLDKELANLSTKDRQKATREAAEWREMMFLE